VFWDLTGREAGASTVRQTSVLGSASGALGTEVELVHWPEPAITSSSAKFVWIVH
jgi:hypothetical protein